MLRSVAALRQLQADHYADDLSLDEQAMVHWSEAECVAYFESGGTELPEPRAASTGPATGGTTVEAAPEQLLVRAAL